MKFENARVFNFQGAIRGMRNPKNSWNRSDSIFTIDSLDNLKDEISKLAYKWCVDKYTGFDVENVFTELEKESLLLPMEDWLLNNGILYQEDNCSEVVFIGPNDMKLMQTLIKSGSEHRKFMRQIFVSVDITAPLYWWAEFDTYKVGTVANSTSKMHTIQNRPITLDCFEIDDCCEQLQVFDPPEYDLGVKEWVEDIINFLETLRQRYNKTEDKRYWKELIRWLPESWLQKRTVTMNYENLFAMCSKGQRRFHKLNEWSGKDLPNLDNFIAFARTLPYAQELIFIDEIVPETVTITKEEFEKLKQDSEDFNKIKKLEESLYSPFEDED